MMVDTVARPPRSTVTDGPVSAPAVVADAGMFTQLASTPVPELSQSMTVSTSFDALMPPVVACDALTARPRPMLTWSASKTNSSCMRSWQPTGAEIRT